MAGWADSGSSRGRGGGGGFANRGGANNSNTRWRARTPAQQQQQQHQHQQQQHQQHQQQQLPQHQQQPHQQHQYQRRYRPVNDNDQSSQHQGPSGELNTHRGQGGFSTSEEYNTHRGQGGFSTSEELNTHRGQGGFSTSTRRPQPTRPPHARPTSTDHKSPAPATDADANAIANEPDDKARRNAANFECNVCFDMAGDPVVTKCGHLFCWECLYQWLHVHSHHRECPVCKGQVADDAIIPIYGRGGSAASVHATPPRPTGARVESSRQQQMHAALDWHEEDNPFAMMSAMMSLMPDLPMETIDDYDDDDFLNAYHRHHFDEVYYNLSGSREYASAGAGSSRRHGHHTSVSDDIMESFYDNTTHQEPDSVYRGGRHQRGRARGAASADHPIFFELERGTTLVLDGSNSSSFRHTGAGPHINNAGGSSRPNGGWTERRGRSNRNSNSGGGGRGGQNNSRRQGAHYNY